MAQFICCACGTQFTESAGPPETCPICEDERQFVPEEGQQWTTLDALRKGHEIVWRKQADGIHSLVIEPGFAIGQRAFFIEGPDGNILWDCLGLIDDATVSRIEAAGGLSAIAISHPHFYTVMAEWSRALGGVPIHLHQDDAEWIQRPDPAIGFWRGDKLGLDGGASLIRCGGHFSGSSVLHCPWLCNGGGALFTGDTLQVTPDRRHVSFMRSYPNLIPLSAAGVTRIAAAVEPFDFDAVFGGFDGRTINSGGKEAVKVSAERYIEAIARKEG